MEPKIVSRMNDKEIINPSHNVRGSPNNVGWVWSTGITIDVKVNIDNTINRILQIDQIILFIYISLVQHIY